MLSSPTRPQIKMNKLENSRSARISVLAAGFACVFLVPLGLAIGGNGGDGGQGGGE